MQVLVGKLISGGHSNIGRRVTAKFLDDPFVDLVSLHAVCAVQLHQALRKAELNSRILRRKQFGLPKKRERIL